MSGIRQVVDDPAERYQEAEDHRAWMVAFSGGKDSTDGPMFEEVGR